MPSNHYRRYPTGLKIGYAEGILPKATLRQIPRSTRHRWKGRPVSGFWTPVTGPLYDSENTGMVKLWTRNQKLKQQLRTRCYLLSVYKSLLRQFKPRLRHLRAIRAQAAVLLRYADQVVPERMLWKHLPFSRQQWNAASRPDCPVSLLQLCRKKHPHQLTIPEQELIRQKCSAPIAESWSLRTIHSRLVHDRELACSLSSFYKYCRLLGISKKTVKKNKVYISIKAGSTFEILHMDVTLFRTADGAKNYIYAIRDNFSRALLACTAASNCCSRIARQLLEEALTKYNLLDKPGTLITDDGSENKGDVDKWLGRPGMLWKRVTAQLDIVRSNSIIEAAHKLFKYNYLYLRHIGDPGHLKKQLPLMMDWQVNMPLYDLCGYTPIEVINGAIPDKQLFKKLVAGGRKERIKTNQQLQCNNTC